MMRLKPWPKVYQLHGNGRKLVPLVSKSLLFIRLNDSSCRFFAAASALRYRQVPTDHTVSVQTPSPTHSISAESVPKVEDSTYHEAPKADALLKEQTVSNKEQRKADWAIMKEMSRYLWPKVWQAKSSVLTQGLILQKG